MRIECDDCHRNLIDCNCDLLKTKPKEINERVRNVDGFNYRIGSLNRNIGRPPRFFSSSDLIPRGLQFCSVYAVREEDARYISETGTASSFRGIVWSQRLWVDFDNLEAARSAQSSLTEKGLDYVVYDTGGGRGCHIGILRDSSPSHLLPEQDRKWVQANLPGADLGLYWHLHLIRLPGAVHERTGGVKRLVARVEGKELVLPPFEPKEVVLRQESSELRQTNPVLRRRSIFTEWSVIEKLQPTSCEGDRHRHILLLASSLKITGVSPSEALWVCLEVNRGFEEPKGEEEIERVVRWAYEQTD